jgi:hypothetical protein
MGTDVIEHGKAMWLLNPLSLTGWVDYSYPISVPMLLTITSTMTGLTRVDLVVALSLLYILLAIAAGFSLGYVYSNSKTLALFTAFAVSLSSEFVLYTSDSGSSSARILNNLSPPKGRGQEGHPHHSNHFASNDDSVTGPQGFDCHIPDPFLLHCS